MTDPAMIISRLVTEKPLLPSVKDCCKCVARVCKLYVT